MNRRTLPPELTIPCPQCRAPRGQYCISRHAVSIHQARRQALRKLSERADVLLRRGTRRAS